MAKPFLITGLPRTKTLWLSHFLTCDDWWCEHEPAHAYGSVERAYRALSQQSHKHPGMADSSVTLQPDAVIAQDWSDVVIIERPFVDALDAFYRASNKMLSHKWIAFMLKRASEGLEAIKEAYPYAIILEYEPLINDSEATRVLCDCLGFTWDEYWYQKFKHSIIQQDVMGMGLESLATRVSGDRYA